MVRVERQGSRYIVSQQHVDKLQAESKYDAAVEWSLVVDAA